jgi:hypothetical protein
VTEKRRLVDLPPFLDLKKFAPSVPDRAAARASVAKRAKIDGAAPWLLAVAMMRAGDKLLPIACSPKRCSARSSTADPADRRRWRGQARGEAGLCQAPCRVEFLGKIAPDELAPLYAAADLLVWPAINEAFGMALLEAQACGLPVLAGAFGGVAGIVADGKTGFLTKPGDVKDFAAGLKRALASDLPALGRAARRKVERRHDIAAASETFARAHSASWGSRHDAHRCLASCADRLNRDQRLQGRTDVALDEEGIAVAARWRAPDGRAIASSPARCSRRA